VSTHLHLEGVNYLETIKIEIIKFKKLEVSEIAELRVKGSFPISSLRK
jgi:hypothetical protein